jgi:hypothetical protein
MAALDICAEVLDDAQETRGRECKPWRTEAEVRLWKRLGSDGLLQRCVERVLRCCGDGTQEAPTGSQRNNLV